VTNTLRYLSHWYHVIDIDGTGESGELVVAKKFAVQQVLDISFCPDSLFDIRAIWFRLDFLMLSGTSLHSAWILYAGNWFWLLILFDVAELTLIAKYLLYDLCNIFCLQLAWSSIFTS